MMASFRRDLRSVSILISANGGGGAGLTVSFGATSALAAPWFLLTLVFLAGAFFFTVRLLVCPSTLPTTIRMAIASTQNLIRYFFIALYLKTGLAAPAPVKTLL